MLKYGLIEAGKKCNDIPKSNYLICLLLYKKRQGQIVDVKRCVFSE
ncbi:MAG: hypothetical protein QME51_10200 [Planctomycetota bacterium]|nr:hypothetical protein [Planctomycetota bacterium]